MKLIIVLSTQVKCHFLQMLLLIKTIYTKMSKILFFLIDAHFCLLNIQKWEVETAGSGKVTYLALLNQNIVKAKIICQNKVNFS